MKRRLHLTSCSILAQTCVLAALSSPVAAQAPDKRSAEPAALEEIVVTAQKRDENLQKTPLSVTVVTGSQLVEKGIVDVRTLSAAAPSLEISYVSVNTYIANRGIGLYGSPSQVDQAVAVNIDGVYLARPNTLQGAFYDIDRIEVLNGPQGTLYGRNTTGGAINITTAKPVFDYAGSAEVEVGNYDQLRFSGMLNAPLGDKIAVRAAFQSNTRDGYYSNGAGKVDATSGRLHVLMQPTDNFKVLLSADYSRLGGDAGTLSPYGAPAWQSPYDQTGAFRKAKHSILRSEVNWDLGGVALTYIGARQNDNDKLLFKAGLKIDTVMHDRTWTHELRLANTSRDDRLQWLLGVYSLQQNGDITSVVTTPVTSSSTFYPRQIVRSRAVFGQGTYSLTDAIRATAGLRYSADKKIQDAFDNLRQPYVNNGSWHATNWRLALEADATENSLVYASASTGFKAGGFFSGRPPNTFDPEKLTAYAVGSKNTLAGGTVRLNAEAFYYDYRDTQVNYFDYVNPFPAFGPKISNAGKSEIYGVDAEASWRISADDRLDLNVSYLHARYKVFTTPATAVPPPNGTPAADYSGEQMTRTPSWSGRISYSHSWRFESGSKLAATISANAAAHQWLDYVHRPQTSQGAYAKVDSSLGFTLPDGNITITGYVRNITNEAVAESYQASGGFQIGYGLPRTYGATISAKF